MSSTDYGSVFGWLATAVLISGLVIQALPVFKRRPRGNVHSTAFMLFIIGNILFVVLGVSDVVDDNGKNIYGVAVIVKGVLVALLSLVIYIFIKLTERNIHHPHGK